MAKKPLALFCRFKNHFPIPEGFGRIKERRYRTLAAKVNEVLEDKDFLEGSRLFAIDEHINDDVIREIQKLCLNVGYETRFYPTSRRLKIFAHEAGVVAS